MMSIYKWTLLLGTLIYTTCAPLHLLGQEWNLLEKLGASDLQPADNLGISVDISDSLVIAGAWLSEGSSGVNNSGAAYIYKLQADGKFKEVAKLSSPNPESLGYFGFSVAISGKSAMVGAYNEDHSGLGNAGRVYVYHCDEENEWQLSETLSVNSPENADYFGHDIAMIEDYALIGAYRHPLDQDEVNLIEEAGAVFLYKREATNKWTFIRKIVAPERSEKDFFGRHVSLDSGGLAISAFNKDGSDGISESGVAYALKCEGNCDFESLSIGEMRKVEASDPNVGLQYGWDLGISGNWLAVGKRSSSSHPDGGSQSNIGAVYFYKWEGGSWVEKQKVYASDYGSNAHFGECIAMEGGLCIIGAGGESKDENSENEIVRAGAAYVFEIDENEVWVQKEKIVGSGRTFTDLFANTGLAIDKNKFVAGAWLADTINGDYLIDGGAAYVYQRTGDLPSPTTDVESRHDLRLFNNPSFADVILKSDLGFKGEMFVYSMNGRMLHHQEIDIFGDRVVDLSSLNSGVYLIKVFNEEGSQIFKWVKK